MQVLIRQPSNLRHKPPRIRAIRIKFLPLRDWVENPKNTAQHPPRILQSIANSRYYSPNPHQPKCPKTNPRHDANATSNSSPKTIPQSSARGYACIPSAIAPAYRHLQSESRLPLLPSLQIIRIIPPWKHIKFPFANSPAAMLENDTANYTKTPATQFTQEMLTICLHTLVQSSQASPYAGLHWAISSPKCKCGDNRDTCG